MSLILLADAKEYLQVYHSREQTTIQMLLDAAEGIVSRLCGVYLSASAIADATEYCDGGGLRLWPLRRPILSLTSVTDRESATVLADMEATKNSVFNTSDPELRFDAGVRRFSVVYKGGYTASTLPAGLKAGILNVLSRLYRNRGGRSQESGAGHSITWQSMDEDLGFLLRPYNCNPPIW